MDYEALRAKLDKQDFYSVLEDFPKQFERAYDYIDSTPQNLFMSVKPNKVLVCGMGGSSLPVDIVNNICKEYLEISLCRTYELPGWVDEETLVFVNSHSGNTEEVLQVLEQARLRTELVVILTSGGELLRKADEYDLPVYLIEKGKQPRTMSAYFVTYMLEVLAEYGLIPNMRNDFLELGAYLCEQDFKNQAKEIVQNFEEDSLPIVYSSDMFSSVARIWKIKINENAKTQCFWNVFPELNHNEMVGFTNLRVKPLFLILRSTLDYPRVRKRMDIFASLLREKSKVEIIDMPGANFLDNLFGSLLLGDWISYFLALKTDVDPTPVDMVEEFKELMKD